MSITGVPDGEPGAGPQKVGVAVADLMAGMYASSGILAALQDRDRTGAGQHIDVALFDTQLAWLANQALNYLVSAARFRTAMARRIRTSCPTRRSPTRDGCLMLAVGNDRQFADSPRRRAPRACERTNASGRMPAASNIAPTLIPAVEKLCRTKTTRKGDCLPAIERPCGPINSIAEVFEDPQVKHRKMRFDLRARARREGSTSAKSRDFLAVRSIIRFRLRCSANTRARFLSAELGLTDAEILSLETDGTIA